MSQTPFSDRYESLIYLAAKPGTTLTTMPKGRATSLRSLVRQVGREEAERLLKQALADRPRKNYLSRPPETPKRSYLTGSELKAVTAKALGPVEAERRRMNGVEASRTRLENRRKARGMHSSPNSGGDINDDPASQASGNERWGSGSGSGSGSGGRSAWAMVIDTTTGGGGGDREGSIDEWRE